MKVLVLITCLVVLSVNPAHALPLRRAPLYCAVLLKSFLTGDLNATAETYRLEKLREKVDLAQKRPVSIVALARGEGGYFDATDMKTFEELSPKNRAHILIHYPFYFSKPQLLSMRKASWYSRIDQDTHVILKMQKAVLGQIKKYDQLAADAALFEKSIDDKYSPLFATEETHRTPSSLEETKIFKSKKWGNRFVYEMSEKDLSQITSPKQYILGALNEENSMKGMSWQNLTVAIEVQNALFELLTYSFGEKLSNSDFIELLKAHQKMKRVALEAKKRSGAPVRPESWNFLAKMLFQLRQRGVSGKPLSDLWAFLWEDMDQMASMAEAYDQPKKPTPFPSDGKLRNLTGKIWNYFEKVDAPLSAR